MKKHSAELITCWRWFVVFFFPLPPPSFFPFIFFFSFPNGDRSDASGRKLESIVGDRYSAAASRCGFPPPSFLFFFHSSAPPSDMPLGSRSLPTFFFSLPFFFLFFSLLPCAGSSPSLIRAYDNERRDRLPRPYSFWALFFPPPSFLLFSPLLLFSLCPPGRGFLFFFFCLMEKCDNKGGEVHLGPRT